MSLASTKMEGVEPSIFVLDSYMVVTTHVAAQFAKWIRVARSTVYKILRQKDDS